MVCRVGIGFIFYLHLEWREVVRLHVANRVFPNEEAFAGFVDGALFIIAIDKAIVVVVNAVVANLANFGTAFTIAAVYKTVAIVIDVVVADFLCKGLYGRQAQTE